MVDLFSPTSFSWNVTPTISSSRGRVDILGPISNSTITTNIISWKIQQSTTFALVRGGILACCIPISTSPFNMKLCSLVAKGTVAGLLWLRSTYINISSAINRHRLDCHTWPTSRTSVITWGIVAGIKRPMSTTFATSEITWGRVAGLNRPMSTTFLAREHFNTFFLGTLAVVS